MPAAGLGLCPGRLRACSPCQRAAKPCVGCGGASGCGQQRTAARQRPEYARAEKNDSRVRCPTPPLPGARCRPHSAAGGDAGPEWRHAAGQWTRKPRCGRRIVPGKAAAAHPPHAAPHPPPAPAKRGGVFFRVGTVRVSRDLRLGRPRRRRDHLQTGAGLPARDVGSRHVRGVLR